MTVGLIVDGQAEPDALPILLRKLRGVGRISRPLYADLQPKAAAGQIARKAISRVRMLRQRGAGRFILLIDREDREDCPPQMAAEIETALRRTPECRGIDVHVVVKDRRFENWLIADPDALASLRARFRVSKAFRKRVSPNKADAVADAEELLRRASVGPAYHKRHDPAKILGAVDVARAAGNSRSLRRFLRLVGDSRYREQSKDAVGDPAHGVKRPARRRRVGRRRV